jgi:hypothetical protein
MSDRRNPDAFETCPLKGTESCGGAMDTPKIDEDSIADTVVMKRPVRHESPESADSTGEEPTILQPRPDPAPDPTADTA